MFSTLFLMNCILGNIVVTFNAFVNVFFNKPNGITKNKNTFISIPTFLSLYSLDFANEEADANKHGFPCPSVCSRSHLRLLSALVWGQSTDRRAKDSPVSGSLFPSVSDALARPHSSNSSIPPATCHMDSL